MSTVSKPSRSSQPEHQLFDRKVLYGITFVGVIALIIAGTIAAYRGTFRSTVPLTVVADRAGLTLAHGSPVKLYGVQVGSVDKTVTQGDKVKVEVKIDSGELTKIPSNVNAEIVPPTAFGAKYVQLDVTGAPAATPIARNAVIGGEHVTTEVNTAFQNLTEVLNVAKPAELNNALTALATAVDGRGEKISTLIGQSNDYLTQFNTTLPTLSTDLTKTNQVLDVYNKAIGPLLVTGNSAAATSDTLVAEQSAVHNLFAQLDTFSGKANGLITSSSSQLKTSLSLLAPVTGLVAAYSPELPCLITGLAYTNKLAESAVGGINPGITTYTRIVPGRDPYTTSKNMAVVKANNGPACYGLPTSAAAQGTGATFFNTGANPYIGAGANPDPTTKLKTTLFGALAGLVNLK